MSTKTRHDLDREVSEALGRGGPDRIRLRYPYYDPEYPPASSKIVEPWNNHRPRRQERQNPTLPKGEVFACLDRNGKICGTSDTVRGAMAKAPEDSSYALVRGEYVSTGAHFGIGSGRQMAVREGGKWIIG